VPADFERLPQHVVGSGAKRNRECEGIVHGVRGWNAKDRNAYAVQPNG
jgi:hypothetical protein